MRQFLDQRGITTDQLKHIVDQLDPQDSDSESPKDLPELEIRIEQHQGQLYAWTVQDNQFLAQGKDREALIQAITDRVCDVRIVVHQSDGAAYLTDH